MAYRTPNTDPLAMQDTVPSGPNTLDEDHPAGDSRKRARTSDESSGPASMPSAAPPGETDDDDNLQHDEDNINDQKWKIHHKDELDALKARIENAVAAFAKKAGADADAVRRALRLHRIGHKKLSPWNKYEKWAKANPKIIEDWDKAHRHRCFQEYLDALPPAQRAHASLDPAVARTWHESHHGLTLVQHYHAMSPAQREVVEKWQRDTSVAGRPEQLRAALNAAYKSVDKLLIALAEDYGVVGVAFLAHPDPDVEPMAAGDKFAMTRLGQALDRLAPGCTNDRLLSVWNGGVSFNPPRAFHATIAKIAERNIAARKANGPAARRPGSPSLGNGYLPATDAILAPPPGIGSPLPLTEARTQALSRARTAAAKALAVLLVERVTTDGVEPGRSEWLRQIQRAKKSLFYPDFFSLLASAGLQVRGWPSDAVLLLAEDGMDKKAEGLSANSSYTILAGSLRSLEHWRKAGAEALLEAVQRKTLTCVVVTPVAPVAPVDS
ncbi:hypothetical protein OC835_006495 [Tilletia horrida]|nr:hypothetical protein OC835_006495 [Tilletia horrida]